MKAIINKVIDFLARELAIILIIALIIFAFVMGTYYGEMSYIEEACQTCDDCSCKCDDISRIIRFKRRK